MSRQELEGLCEEMQGQGLGKDMAGNQVRTLSMRPFKTWSLSSCESW